jgi:hypothetical protein
MSEEKRAMKRFIVTGQGRCGSNLLKFALKQNPQCYMVGEYYNPSVCPDIATLNGAARAEDFFRGEELSLRRTCLGFKIFSQQARVFPASTVWDAGAWTSKVGKQKEAESIVIDRPAKWWAERLEKDEAEDQRLKELFQRNPYFLLRYEDLIAEWKRTTSEIQEFLGIPPLDLEVVLTKQESLKKSERLPNFAKLQSHFADTNYGWMFRD